MNEIVIHRYLKDKAIIAKINTIWSDSMSKKDRRYRAKYGIERYKEFMETQKKAKNTTALWGKDTINVRDKIEFASYWTKNINNIYRDVFELKNRYIKGIISGKYKNKIELKRNVERLTEIKEVIKKGENKKINNGPLYIIKLGHTVESDEK